MKIEVKKQIRFIFCIFDVSKIKSPAICGAFEILNTYYFFDALYASIIYLFASMISVSADILVCMASIIDA